MTETKKHDETKPKLKTVYDQDGKAYEVESVDAREYVASGRYTYEPPKPAQPEVKHEVKEPATQKPSEEAKKA